MTSQVDCAAVTNELGDVIAIEAGGVKTPVDPREWGWLNVGGRNDLDEQRRSLDALKAIPGFRVTTTPCESFIPGQRPDRGQKWMTWSDGAAPPTAVESKGGTGSGTLAYYSRLSEAVGNVAHRLPVNPARGPMVIWDFVAGQRHDVTYEAGEPNLDGKGTVYLLDDGMGIKIGYTYGPVAKRVGELQTGNPRRILTLAEIRNVDVSVEVHLQKIAAEWSVGGEWYDRQRLMLKAIGLGGIEQWVRSSLGEGAWTVIVHPPYR